MRGALGGGIGRPQSGFLGGYPKAQGTEGLEHVFLLP